MLQWLKNHFIPHPGNDHKPHLLRWEATFSIIGAALLIEVVFLLQVLFVFPTNFLAIILPDVIVDLTNVNREANAAEALAENPVLQGAAQKKAEDMAAKGYFAHYAPDGTSPWYWFKLMGYSYSYAGENLAVNFVDSKDVVDAWMNSPKHRENIVNGHYTEIGIGIAEGTYQGRTAVFVVQFFGRPATVAAVPASVTTPAAARPIQPGGGAQVAGATSSTTTAPVAVVKPAAVEAPEVPTSAPDTEPVPVPVLESDFVAVRGEGVDATTTPTTSVAAAGTAGNIPQSSVVGRLLSSPHEMTNYLYGTLFTIVLAALLLTVFVKIRIQHPRLIVNGVLMLIVIATALVANQYIALAGAGIK
jgi:hypothetical protein